MQELFLSFPDLEVGDEICVTVRFSSPNGDVQLKLNDENPIEFENPSGANTVHEFCILVTTLIPI